MYPSSDQLTSGYDRVSTMFSPKGRLYQVEYASKIVEQGTTGVGFVYNNGVLLGAEKNVGSNLVVPESIEKLFKIDKHIGIISAGLVGDARRLVKVAREKAQENRMTFEEPIGTETLVREIAAIKQAVTQYGGMRPFGVSFVFGGITNNLPKIFETEPSGALAEYKAVAIGRGKKEVMNFLEKNYRQGLSKEAGVKLLFDALKTVKRKTPLTIENLDFSFIEAGAEYTKLSLKELKSFLGNKKS